MSRLSQCLFATLIGSALLLLLSCGDSFSLANDKTHQALPPGAPPVPTASDP